MKLSSKTLAVASLIADVLLVIAVIGSLLARDYELAIVGTLFLILFELSRIRSRL